MIQKILVANRGEIAARIIRTCRKLAIQTVAVYSEADEHAPYVKLADEQFLLGAPRVNESYLNADKIFETAKKSEADAIHPGYGFLSESSEFAKRCEEQGLIFIGPDPEVMQKMGSKIEARKAMKQAGISIIPGTQKAIDTVEEALKTANEMGYPIMLKASAGGGGIGMQVVHSDEELAKVFASNVQRAQNFFGDGAMFLEKKIENARHIEVQILADKHGNTIHAFERDCSMQRRNQKVLEESPSFLSEKTRLKMGTDAVKAAQALGYTNAGTIEFLVDEQENYYFLEMNTRIQVEHPVTEEITGLDIVEEQINIANGQILSFNQQDLTIKGHAIEARIYAEDPESFLPSPGHIDEIQWPEGKHVRHDSSIKKGYDVSPFYDPMISKIIVWGINREAAINELNKALDQFQINGIKTNIPMLKRMIRVEPFINGQITTDFIEEKYLPMLTKTRGT